MTSSLEFIKNFFIDKTVKKQNSLIDEFSNESNINNKEYIQDVLGKIELIKNDITVGVDVYNDVEFFENFSQGMKSKTVFDIFDSFHTIGSKSLAKSILSQPLSDINTLYKSFELLLPISNDDELLIFFNILSNTSFLIFCVEKFD